MIISASTATGYSFDKKAPPHLGSAFYIVQIYSIHVKGKADKTDAFIIKIII